MRRKTKSYGDTKYACFFFEGRIYCLFCHQCAVIFICYVKGPCYGSSRGLWGKEKNRGFSSPYNQVAFNSSRTTFRPTWSRTKTENCVNRRTKRTNPLVLTRRRKKENGGSFLTVKWLSAPFAQGTSSENKGTGWEPSVWRTGVSLIVIGS